MILQNPIGSILINSRYVNAVIWQVFSNDCKAGYKLCVMYKKYVKKLVKLRYVNIFQFSTNQDDIINAYHQDTKFHDPPENLFWKSFQLKENFELDQIVVDPAS